MARRYLANDVFDVLGQTETPFIFGISQGLVSQLQIHETSNHTVWFMVVVLVTALLRACKERIDQFAAYIGPGHQWYTGTNAVGIAFDTTARAFLGVVAFICGDLLTKHYTYNWCAVIVIGFFGLFLCYLKAKQNAVASNSGR